MNARTTYTTYRDAVRDGENWLEFQNLAIHKDAGIEAVIAEILTDGVASDAALCSMLEYAWALKRAAARKQSLAKGDSAPTLDEIREVMGTVEFAECVTEDGGNPLDVAERLIREARPTQGYVSETDAKVTKEAGKAIRKTAHGASDTDEA